MVSEIRQKKMGATIDNENYEEAQKWEKRTQELERKIEYAKILSAAAKQKHEEKMEKLQAEFVGEQSKREKQMAEYKERLA